MKIEGIPEGYEVVRIGTPLKGEWFILHNGKIMQSSGSQTDKNYPILRKVERPKQYRPFANGAEYSPHFNRQVVEANDDNMTYLPIAFDNNKVWLGPDFGGNAWDEAFRSFKFKDDGTPFGVEVSE
jgi:hypothetical protein